MNKFRKILCAVLVLAVLCSALALVVNADPVTPTVTVVQDDADTKAIATAGVAGYEGNSLAASLAWSHADKVDAYIITENGDEDPYVGLVVAPGQTGAIGTHIQHTLMPGSNPPAIKNDGWSVIEIDMATQSSMITGIGIAPCNRNSKGATTAAFSQAFTVGSYVNLTSDWTRITVVQDFSNNIQYLYVNGAYAGKVGYAYSGTVLPEDYTGGADVETVGLFDYGFKLEISTANVANEGQSVMYDNASRRTFTAQEATDNGLVALMATPETANLNSWGIKGVGRTGSLPVVAKYNGVEYNNVSKLAAATYGQVGVVVEALGENAQYVLATNNMTVNTNGMKFGVATRAGGSVTENADGTLTVVSPFVESSTDGPVIVSSDADMKSVVATIKNPDSNNRFSAFQNNITEANFMNAWITTNTLDQVSYLNVTTSDYEGKSQSKNPGNGQLWWGNAYFEIQSWGTFNYDETKNQFVVFDFDFALLTNGSVGTMPVPREGSNGLWGADNTNISSWASSFPLGEFHHYTFAFDLNNNVLYTYVDGALRQTDNTGYTTAANHSNVFRAGKTLAFNGLRIGSATADAADYAINSIRILHVSEDAEGFGSTSLSQAVKGTKIDTWENSITETITAIAPIATIDNQPYYSVAAMNETLVGEELKVVNILKAFKSKLVVDSNATIYTNGLNVTVVAGAIANEPVKDGDVITVEIPYVPSASEIVAANGLAGVATDVPGNIITSGGALVNNVTDNFNAYVVNDGNREYIKFVAPADGLTATNPYVQFENGNVDLPLDGYYVIDLEVATESSLLNFSINPIARNTSPISGQSNYPFGTSVYLQPLAGPSDEWAHITIVGDMAANKEYIFINGELVNANYGAAYAAGDNYHGGKLSAKGVRVNVGQKVGYRGGESFLFDNLSYRIFTASEKTAIDTALATKTTNNWTNSLYKGSNDKLPALVEIDGVPYGNVYTASEALCKEYENVVNAEFRKSFIGTITIGTSAIVDTNGIGTYKVVTGAPVETEVEGEMAIIYAPFACEVDGETVTVTKLTEENVYDFATSVYWCYGDINDDIYSEYETVYYPAGTAITYYGNNAAATYGNYIVDGTLTTFKGWYAEDEYDAYVTEFGTATAGDSYAYVADIETATTEITLPGAMYNLSLSTDYKINLFVPKASYAGEAATTVTAGGVEYVVLTKGVAATEIANAVEFLVTYTVDGVEYTEVVEVSVLEYAEKVMASDYSKMLKRTIMAALNYSETAIEELVNAEGDAAIKAILNAEANAEFKTEDTGDYGAPVDFTKLTFLTGGQVHIDAAPDFVFNVRKGFVGTITFTYEGVEGTVVVTKEVDASESGVQISLNDIKVYDLAATFTIASEGTITASGEFTLGTYIQALAESNNDSATAKALYVYAGVANIYKKACIAASAEA